MGHIKITFNENNTDLEIIDVSDKDLSHAITTLIYRGMYLYNKYGSGEITGEDVEVK